MQFLLYVPLVKASFIHTKRRFPLEPYRSETWRISLFRERSGRTNDINTLEHSPFRYDTVEVENRLKL